MTDNEARGLKFWRRLALVGSDNRDVIQSLVALGLLVVTAVVAGVTLGESSTTLESLPGLLLMVPAAIALRGNIFGALGSRLGTSIHTGTFSLSLRPGSVVGDNVIGSFVLTLVVSTALALFAKATSVIFGIADSISLAGFVVISLVGGLLASVVVLLVALLLTSGAARYGWDPDNVTAPLVTATGDVATVPALVFASRFVGDGSGTQILAGGLVAASVGLAVVAVRFGNRELRQLLVESLPVLLIAVVIDLIAGVTIERRLVSLVELPTLLVLLPAYLAVAGALGGILSSRLSTRLHLGLLAPSALPGRDARPDLIATFGLAVPVFWLSGLLASSAGSLFGLTGPSALQLIALALIGGLIATAIAAVVAYYGTLAAVNFGLDPDTYGIPLVTSVLDLAGAFTFIGVVELLGIL